MSLKDYLMQLAESPDKVRALRADPEAEMKKAGLTDSDKQVIRSADAGKIRAALMGGATPRGDNVVVIVVVAIG
ncbi:MAG TPA: hypothetical protein VN782_02845 [Usitatibacter sp.]|nr:hypothetical protein [Usitatibacter sp.]